MATDRDKQLDYLKFIAAVLVIVGHSIQYSGVLNVNKGFEFVYLVIYSFHMPLFAMISGFLLCKTLGRREMVHAFKGKCILLIPAFVYSIPVFFSRGVYASVDGPLLNIRHFIGFTLIGNGLVWFLPVIFISSVFLMIIGKVKYSDILILLSIVSTIFWINNYFIAQLAFIYVFCAIGFICARQGLKEKAGKPVFVVSVFLYMVSIILYKREYLIYNGEWGIIGTDSPMVVLTVDILRIVIGAAGCVVLYYMVKMSGAGEGDIKPVVGLISRNTLGTYCISNLIFEYVTPLCKEINVYAGFVITLIISSVVSVLLCLLFEKNRYLRIVFLGHK